MAIFTGMNDSAIHRGVPWTLLSLAPLPPEVLRWLFAELPVELVVADSLTEVSAADRARVELIVGDWRIGSPGVDAEVAAALPRLAFVQQPSVGVQSHDADALAAAGIPLANCAGFNAAAVIEWTIGATLSISRMLRWAEDEMRAGRWPQTEIAQRGSSELSGRPVGIVGFGPIGQGFARVFAGLRLPGHVLVAQSPSCRARARCAVSSPTSRRSCRQRDPDQRVALASADAGPASGGACSRSCRQARW